MRRYLILGSGAAGFAAAETIRQRDPGGDITLLTDDPAGFYSRPGLAYYLTGELPENQLFPVRSEHFKRLRLRFLHGRAVHLDPQNHRLRLEDHRLLSYDRLLIAVGAQAVPLSLPGAELNGVLKLDHLLDARRILALARKARRAVVVGGGITALELVEGLAARKLKVHYLLRGDRYWSNVLDETESRIVEQRLVDHGVRIHYRTELAEILGRKGSVAAVRTRQGEIIPCEIVAYAIGIQPRLGLAQSAGLETGRGILTDAFLRASAEDVFAAGDVAQVYDPQAGKPVLDSLWNPARQQGACAGENMAGSAKPYLKTVPFNVTRLAGLTTTIIGSLGHKDGESSSARGDLDLSGIARGDSETWRELPDAIAAQTGFEVNRLRLMVGEKHLLGALVMGDQTVSYPLQRLIHAQAEITPIRHRLLAPNAPLTDILIDFYQSWRATHDPHP